MALFAWRIGLGAWLLVVPFLFGHRLDGYGLDHLLVGAVVMACAWLCERRPALRLLQFGAGLWLMVSPFVFDVALVPLCHDVVLAKWLIVTAAASSNMFR
jgi:hypothetical protein